MYVWNYRTSIYFLDILDSCIYLFIHIYHPLLGTLRNMKETYEMDIFTVLINVQGTLNKD